MGICCCLLFLCILYFWKIFLTEFRWFFIYFDSSIFYVWVVLLSVSMFCLLVFVMVVFPLLFILVFTCLSDYSFVSFCTMLASFVVLLFLSVGCDCLFEFADLKWECLFCPVQFVLSHFHCLLLVLIIFVGCRLPSTYTFNCSAK